MTCGTKKETNCCAKRTVFKLHEEDMKIEKTLEIYKNKHTFGIFYSRISCSWRNVVSLCEQLKVMNKSFHRCFHFGSLGCHDLSIVNTDLTRWHLIEALLNYAERFPHLFNTTQVPEKMLNLLHLVLPNGIEQ